MEISTEINKKENLRCHIVRDAIDISDLTEHLNGIYNSSDFDPEMNVLWDLSNSDFSSVAMEDVWFLKKFVSNYWGTKGKSKAALVISHDSNNVMSSIYKNMMKGPTSSEIVIFRDIEKAQKWLETKT